MSLWFLETPTRLALERAKINELLRSADWLLGADWGFDLDSGGLRLDAVIQAHSHDYEFRLTFPTLFPDAPIVVRPKNVDRRLSQHQYGGADGPLCLEWGPDNWQHGVTAAMMLESTHKLLEIENPLGQNRAKVPVVAPSRHRLETGQEVRGAQLRFYGSGRLKEFMAAQASGTAGGFEFSLRNIGGTRLALVHHATPSQGARWSDTVIPTVIPEADSSDLYSGVWLKAEVDQTVIGESEDLDALQARLKTTFTSELLARDGSSPVKGFERAIGAVLVSGQGGSIYFFVVSSGNRLWRATVVESDMTSQANRSPQAASLVMKKVGIVGLGSAGSKIAISLARMGVRKFFLSDYDLLLPENLQRHGLDWRGVLLHKVDAMAVALRAIAADTDIEVSQCHLTGQESNSVVNGTLNRLAGCDLIIDATGNSKAFNLLGGVVRTCEKPMVWLEVFGDGVGGLIARSRPGVDPCPLDMRASLLRFCSENPAPAELISAVDYATETAGGQVLCASDAEVSIIAHHAARLAVDCLTAGESSSYPHSMYLVGLSKCWVFRAPFDTIAVEVNPPVTAERKAEEKLDPETVGFILQLLGKDRNESAPAG